MKAWLWFLLALAASAVSWSYVHRVLLPWEYFVNVQRGQLKAQMGDLYPRWVGTRELLLNGRNPYGKEVSDEIQMGFYGHPIEQSYNKAASEIIDEQRFVYPVYVVFLLAPTAHADFAKLQNWTPWVFGALTALGVWLWLLVLRWRPPMLITASAILLVLSSPQIAQGLRLRQFGLFVAFLIAFACWCVTRDRYFFGGALLAVATIKPQMVALCVAWFLLWSLGDWRKRWPLAAGFGVTIGFMGGAGELLLPGWLHYFFEGLEAYRKYFPTTSPLRLVFGDWVGGMLSVFIIVGLAAFSWRKSKVAAGSEEFVQQLALVLITTSLVLPLLTPYNQVLLILPVLLLIRDWGRLPRAGRIGFTALVGWPAVVSLALLIYAPRLDSLNRLPLLPAVLALLFPFVVPLLMYFRREEPTQPAPVY
ncbi:MAG: glycosyltransferase family 87 protein [Candidatus Sulfotelmatobacter sp.]